MMKVGARVCLKPTQEQLNSFKNFAGAARFAYNRAIWRRYTSWKEFGYICNKSDLRHGVKDLRFEEGYEWLDEIPMTVINQAVDDSIKAYKDFLKNKKKPKPKNRKITAAIRKKEAREHPDFKKKNQSTPSFYLDARNIVIVDKNHIKVPKIETPIEITEPLLGSKRENARIIFDGKYWYLAYAYEVQELPMKTEGDVIGVDLGIKETAVCSNGDIYHNINKSREVRRLEKKKRRLQRKLSRKIRLADERKKARKEKGIAKKDNEDNGKNIKKLKDAIKLVYRRLTNIRHTYTHQITSSIVSKAKIVGIEDLNVSGMMKDKSKSRAIQEQEWYTIREQLTYKCKFYGVKLVIADRFYSSTKTTNCCGYKFKYVSLNQRTLICPICGKKMDRDMNAAMNLKDYALAH